THELTSGLVPAYVSSPELTFGFLFALEDPERIAEVVRGLMERKTVSVFRLPRLADDAGPPERYVVNWAAIPQISITTDAPDADVLRAAGVVLVVALLGEGGEARLASAEGRTAEQHGRCPSLADASDAVRRVGGGKWRLSHSVRNPVGYPGL